MKQRNSRTVHKRHENHEQYQNNQSTYLEQIGLFLPFICTPEELLGEENAE